MFPALRFSRPNRRQTEKSPQQVRDERIEAARRQRNIKKTQSLSSGDKKTYKLPNKQNAQSGVSSEQRTIFITNLGEDYKVKIDAASEEVYFHHEEYFINDNYEPKPRADVTVETDENAELIAEDDGSGGQSASSSIKPITRWQSNKHGFSHRLRRFWNWLADLTADDIYTWLAVYVAWGLDDAFFTPFRQPHVFFWGGLFPVFGIITYVFFPIGIVAIFAAYAGAFYYRYKRKETFLQGKWLEEKFKRTEDKNISDQKKVKKEDEFLAALRREAYLLYGDKYFVINTDTGPKLLSKAKRAKEIYAEKDAAEKKSKTAFAARYKRYSYLERLSLWLTETSLLAKIAIPLWNASKIYSYYFWFIIMSYGMLTGLKITEAATVAAIAGPLFIVPAVLAGIYLIFVLRDALRSDEEKSRMEQQAQEQAETEAALSKILLRTDLALRREKILKFSEKKGIARLIVDQSEATGEANKSATLTLAQQAGIAKRKQEVEAYIAQVKSIENLDKKNKGHSRHIIHNLFAGIYNGGGFMVLTSWVTNAGMIQLFTTMGIWGATGASIGTFVAGPWGTILFFGVAIIAAGLWVGINRALAASRANKDKDHGIELQDLTGRSWARLGRRARNGFAYHPSAIMSLDDFTAMAESTARKQAEIEHLFGVLTKLAKQSQTGENIKYTIATLRSKQAKLRVPRFDGESTTILGVKAYTDKYFRVGQDQTNWFWTMSKDFLQTFQELLSRGDTTSLLLRTLLLGGGIAASLGLLGIAPISLPVVGIIVGCSVLAVFAITLYFYIAEKHERRAHRFLDQIEERAEAAELENLAADEFLKVMRLEVNNARDPVEVAVDAEEKREEGKLEEEKKENLNEEEEKEEEKPGLRG